ARAEAGDGVQRPGDELPERFELLERRAAGVIVVRSWRLSVFGVAARPRPAAPRLPPRTACRPAPGAIPGSACRPVSARAPAHAPVPRRIPASAPRCDPR